MPTRSTTRFASNANLDEIAQESAGAEAAIEATSNYYTIYDTLDEHLDVVVADPNQTKALGVVEAKNDRLDAKLLAQLRSAGMIAESYVPSKELRERRALVRGRKQLVEKQNDFKNLVHSVLGQQGISYEWDPFSQKGREILAPLDTRQREWRDNFFRYVFHVRRRKVLVWIRYGEHIQIQTFSRGQFGDSIPLITPVRKTDHLRKTNDLNIPITIDPEDLERKIQAIIEE